MATEVLVTVKVDDAQFKAFAKSFEDFTNKIKGLDNQFKSVSKSMDETTKTARGLTNTLRGMLESSNKVYSQVKEITTHFGKWATLISSTIMMLGSGAGMFGIDRLLNSFIQRQRQALGLGTSFGALQAAQAGTQIFPGSSVTRIQAIQTALHDPASPARKGLAALGIDPTGKTPDQIEQEVLKKAPEVIKRLPKGAELMAAQQMHLTDLLGVEKIQAEINKPGTLERERKFLERFRKEVPQLTDEEKDKLEKLFQSWTIFAETFKTDLMKLLALLEPYLSKASVAAGGMLGAGTGVGKAAGKSTLDAILEALDPRLHELIMGKDKEVEEPIKNFKKNMDDLNKETGDLVSKLNSQLSWWEQVKRLLGFSDTGGTTTTTTTGGGNQPAVKTDTTTPKAETPAPAIRSPTSHGRPRTQTTPPPPPPNATTTTAQPPVSGNTPRIGSPQPPPSSVTTMPTSGGTVRVGGGGGGFSLPSTGAIPPARAGGGIVPGAVPPAFTMPGGQSSLQSRNNFAMRFAPGEGGLGSVLAQNNQMLMAQIGAGGGGRGRGGQGPLDMDQWQMGRTATINVHNEHPSIRMDINGMG